jgi:serine/threonine-protein kinase RsbT
MDMDSLNFPPGRERPNGLGVRNDDTAKKRTRFTVSEEMDILQIGRKVWETANEMGFSSVESMHLRTAVSELGRNILKYAQEGEVLMIPQNMDTMKLIFIDRGPGIEDIEQAMQYGFSTGGSLGLGLPGSRKLADRFEISSNPGEGSRITFVKFKRTARKTSEILLRLSKPR